MRFILKSKILFSVLLLLNLQLTFSQVSLTFNQTGSFSWTPPINVDSLTFEVWGGGGGGGGCYSVAVGSPCCWSGGGGGGGGYAKKTISTLNFTNKTFNFFCSPSLSGNGGSTWVKNNNLNIASSSGGGSGGNAGFNQFGSGGTGGVTCTCINGCDTIVLGQPGLQGVSTKGGNGGASYLAGSIGLGGAQPNNPLGSFGQDGTNSCGGGGRGVINQCIAATPFNPLSKGGKGKIHVTLLNFDGLGKIFFDNNYNCNQDSMDYGIEDLYINIIEANLVIKTDNYGNYFIPELPIGTYHVEIGLPFNYTSSCPTNFEFSVTHLDSINLFPSIGIYPIQPCSSPEITIFAPSLRRCFSNQIVYVQACNDIFADSSLSLSNVVINLDPLLTLNSASLPFTALGNNTYQFQTGTLNPGQCINFTLSTTVSCAATLGQTLCMNAELFPVENCALDTLPSGPNWDNIPSEGALGGLPQPCLGPWDQSSLSVDGWCQNDSIYFTVTNTGVLGGGDMECYAPVWLTVNGVVTFTDSIMLQGGQTITYAFAGNGQTWILNASQHPLHPGNSQPNAFVERCGNAANWTPGEVNDYPQDDADPVIDIFCEEVSGSYDPNDKRGYPNGVTNMNYIQPNQQLQYVIRFQNTGTDTAFTVVIRDTLDTDLNIFTVTSGVSSHSYEFRMYGPRVLEWRFDNILLPDSTTNSVGSNGFVTFHVEQNPNLSPGTVINNDADIYFDYNDPITTNTTVHRIYEGFPNVLSLQDLVNSKESIVLYPNPTSSEITITSDKFTNEPYTLYDQMGRTVGSGKLSGTNTTISLSTLSKGVYILKVEGAYESAIVVKE
jgi:uncharacterized repeat protein (TIGR01451 family)